MAGEFGNWSENEVELIVSDYFSMLLNELVGKLYNKTRHRNSLKALLNNRSDGSIEFKHQNISAVLIKLGLPFIIGYKPKWNYQQILETKVIEFIKIQKATLEPKFNRFSESQFAIHVQIDFLSMLVKPPERQFFEPEPEIEYWRKPIKTNYLEREQNNFSLGQSGEKLILDYEKWRLTQLGKDSLADKVEWIAENDDGAGFDILSKNLDNSDRYIEVKTTKLTKETPIYFSKNEYEFSLNNETNFHLYRVFNFGDTPKLFTLSGSFDQICTKEATKYKGYF